ncbi:MAG: zinc dependent phospholipase C family protein [Erysipelotrichaceae bacterium]|nr:zinc dependent phospholipase C family protein [Erysipelotrichaceae bacterium]
MPTTYTHYRFGNDCKQLLPESLETIIDKHRAVFNYGVQGPDIFFYYKCIKNNEVNRFGNDLHYLPFKDTLVNIKENYLRSDHKEEMLAYLLGFTCHFLLDSECHSFVEAKKEKSGISHLYIESQLDRYYLKKDGKDPLKTYPSATLKYSKEVALVISECFGKFDEKVTEDALRDMSFYLNVLKDSNDVKRFVLSKMLDATGAGHYKDLFLTKYDDPNCADANLRLDKHYQKALTMYAKLAESLVSYLMLNKDLDEYFDNHFCQKEDYLDIPVLSLEEEQNYVI